MKPSSPLSVFLLLGLASASPILSKDGHFPSDCQGKSCAALRTALLKQQSPPNNLPAYPHFPPHQLSSSPSSDEPFDNAPVTPSSESSRTEALSAAHPLSSTYLLSLSNSAAKPAIQKAPSPSEADETTDTDALPSKPTSALPELRKEDARRYWASIKGAATKEVKIVATESPRPRPHCGELMRERYIAISGTLARDYSDLMVIGIVILFLVAVVALEALEKIGDLRAVFSGNPRPRRGEIFLEDDETIAFIIKKPFTLQSPPPPRYKIREDRDQEFGEEAEAFIYDNDADEKV